ncbi:exosortase E/protease, VPEID-CTERM system [Rhodobacteraceae bacterium M382]|nr:exosortase E/protease, VPEID-CTERM system [Rhodobacteraceae bacterium M382]
MSNRIYWIIGLFALEVLAIVLVFQVFSSVECRLTDIETACRVLRSALIRMMCLGVGLGVFIWFRPQLRRQVVQSAAVRPRDELGLWSFVHLVGLVLIFLPWLSADANTLNGTFPTYFLSLALGGVCAAVGGVFMVLSWRDVVRFGRAGGVALAVVVLIALVIPDFADVLAPLWWSLNGLLLATFYGVAVVLSALGNDVTLNPDASIIGTGDFFVGVADTCSGIEGFALTAGFFAIYSMLMRDTVKLGLFWGLIFPIALLISWFFNVLRIAGLILIGEYVSPDLAVNGFHSFAGWLFFTLLALGVLWVVQAMPSLHRASAATPDKDLPPLTEDTTAAFIVPFIVFMVSGLFAQTFWQYPVLAYPVQMAAMVAILWVFRKPFLGLDWGFDPTAFAAGGLVGVGWLVTASTGATQPGLSTLGAGALVAWGICRILGTSLLVPMIEEAFFRGYLLRWLGGDHVIRTVFAVAGSSLAFAMLHGRLIEAGVAGVIFALVALRRGRVTDAIIAHATANGVIAIAAAMSGDWSLI